MIHSGQRKLLTIDGSDKKLYKSIEVTVRQYACIFFLHLCLQGIAT